MSPMPANHPNHINLSRCPIVEALIEVSVTAGPIDMSALKMSAAELDNNFPEEIVVQNIHADINPDVQQAKFSNAISGYMYKSPDGKRVVQSRHGQYTFNVLAPYNCWDDFRNDAIKYWQAYRGRNNPNGINKLGIRYINNIVISDGDLDQSAAFNVNLQFGDVNADYGSIKQMQYRYISEFPDLGCTAVVNFVRQHSDSYMLDIDITKMIPGISLDDAVIVEYLEGMRNIKNNIFFGTITKETLDLYK